MNQTSTSTWPTHLCEFLSVFNIFLSITASLGNVLILVALHKESSLHPPTKLLFRCLAVTDLCVGVVSQPLFAVSLTSLVTTAVKKKAVYYIDHVYNASSFVFCEVSVFTSAAISVDRLLALLLGLRYRYVVTLRRVSAVLICFWLIGVSCGSVYFLNSSVAFTAAFALLFLSIATSFFSFTKIYFMLRHHQLQVRVSQRQPNVGRLPLNIARYKKSVFSVFWVQLSQVICYVPFIIVIMLNTYGHTSGNDFQVAFFFTVTLTYLNSFLNPILYCWRIGTVRQAAKSTIKQLNCCKST